MFDVEKSIAEAHLKFKELADYVLTEGQSQDAYAVERRLFRDGLKVLGRLLEAYFGQQAAGDTARSSRPMPASVCLVSG